MKKATIIIISIILICGVFLTIDIHPAIADSVNLLTNPGFENRNANWASPNGWTGIVQICNTYAYDGSNSVEISTTDNTINPYISQTVHNIVPNDAYRLSAWLKINNLGSNSSGCFKLDFYQESTQTFLGSKTITLPSVTNGKWQQLVLPFNAPVDCTEIVISLRLLGTGTVYFDGASLTAVTNLFTNSGFENGNTGWSSPNGWSGVVQISDVAYSGASSVVISTNGSQNPLISQNVMQILEGSQYEMTVIFKTSGFVSGSNAELLLNFYDSNSNFIASQVNTFSSNTNGQWRSLTLAVETPQNCGFVNACLRLLGTGTVYYDDAFLIKTKDPKMVFLDTDWVFYYSDMQQGTATVTRNPYYTNLNSATADFSLNDGDTVLLSISGRSLSSGSTSFDYDLNYLSVKNKEYTVNINVKDSNGITQASVSQSIYKYDRPQYLGSDGIYLKNGTTSFDPIFAYHVSLTDYSYCAAAGINVVQSSMYDTVAQMQTCLNTAQSSGLMVLMVLYNNMEPAGSYDNVAHTQAMVTAFKDHPALFAYAIMDEPSFYGLNDMTGDLRNSYKIIRDIDPKHPVYCVASQSSYYREASKYVDILAVDPYPGSSGNQTTCVKTAVTSAFTAARNQKPVYAVEQAFRLNGYLPTGYEERHMIYQSFIAGAKAFGYFSFSDSDKDLNGNYIPLYNTQLWSPSGDGGGITSFYSLESMDAFGFFVHNLYPQVGADQTNNVLWRTYNKNDDIYAILLNLDNTSKTVTIPMVGIQNTSTVSAVNGCASGTASVINNQLSAQLTGNQAAVYKIAPQYIRNCGFEDGDSVPTSWSLSGGEVSLSNESPYEGVRCVKAVSPSGAYPFVSQNVASLIAGHQYKLSFYFKSTSGTATPIVKFEYGAGGEIAYGSSMFTYPVAGEWTKYTLNFTVPVAASQEVMLLRGTPSLTVYYDQVTIEPVQ